MRLSIQRCRTLATFLPRLCVFALSLFVSTCTFANDSTVPPAPGPGINLSLQPVTTLPGDSSQFALAGYKSPRLKADLLAEFYFLDIPGHGRVTFWGVRVVGMETDSPLKTIPGFNLGDVITRLDGLRIGRGLNKPLGQEFYNVPQAERHFAITEVRWVKSGTNIIRNSTVDLGPRTLLDPDPILP